MCGYPMETSRDTTDWGKYKKHVRKFITKPMLEAAKAALPAYLFTYKKNGKLYGYCSGCGHDMKLTGDKTAWKHNEEVKCPKCGGNVYCKDSWRGRMHLSDKVCMLYYRKSPVSKNVITGVMAVYTRDYFGDYRKADVFAESIEDVYVFEFSHGGVRFRNRDYSSGGVTLFRMRNCKTHIIRNPHIYGGSLFAHVEDTDSLYEAMAGTVFERFPVKDFLECYSPYSCERMAVELLDKLSRYKVTEYLLKLKWYSIVNDMAYGHDVRLNHRGKTAAAVLSILPEYFSGMKGGKFIPDVNNLKGLQAASKLAVPFEKALLYAGNFNIEYMADISCKYGLNINTLFNYLLRQREKDNAWKINNSLILHDYSDYLGQCKKLDMDIADTATAFPKDLRAAHDKLTERIRYKEDEILNNDIRKGLKKLASYYIDSLDGYIMRPAASATELIAEGNALKHCVGGYVRRYAKGDTVICFVRRKGAEDTPLYTAEFRPKDRELMQIRGYGNLIADDDRESLDAFMDAVKEILKNKKEKTA